MALAASWRATSLEGEADAQYQRRDRGGGRRGRVAAIAVAQLAELGVSQRSDQGLAGLLAQDASWRAPTVCDQRAVHCGQQRSNCQLAAGPPTGLKTKTGKNWPKVYY